MSDVQVKFKRGNTSTLNSTPITDGLIYFNTENKHIYMDNGISRLEYSNDMSNFMDKTTIANLVPKNSDLIKNPKEIDRIIGDAYIGDTTILDAVDDLYQNKALFKVVWEDTDPQPFETKTITIDGIYPFYFIFRGYMGTEPNVQFYKEDDYDIILNNNTVYTSDNGFGNSIAHNIVVDKVRKIQITSNTTTQKTTFTFNQYGTYKNGTWVQGDVNTNLQIPFKIIGIINT